MPALGLAGLVANRTLSPEIGATLWAAVEQRRSFLVIAIPRLAGKTTVMNAMLARVPAGVAVHEHHGEASHLEALTRDGDGGYLLVPEISQAPVPGYIWGEPVRRVFRALGERYSLATALHAPGVREAFEVIGRGNGVPDRHAARLEIAVYIRTLGDDWQAPERRVVAEVHEILGVSEGRPDVRLLHRWDEALDRFQQTAESSLLAGDAAAMEARAATLLREAGGSAALR